MIPNFVYRPTFRKAAAEDCQVDKQSKSKRNPDGDLERLSQAKSKHTDSDADLKEAHGKAIAEDGEVGEFEDLNCIFQAVGEEWLSQAERCLLYHKSLAGPASTLSVVRGSLRVDVLFLRMRVQ